MRFSMRRRRMPIRHEPAARATALRPGRPRPPPWWRSLPDPPPPPPPTPTPTRPRAPSPGPAQIRAGWPPASRDGRMVKSYPGAIPVGTIFSLYRTAHSATAYLCCCSLWPWDGSRCRLRFLGELRFLTQLRGLLSDQRLLLFDNCFQRLDLLCVLLKGGGLRQLDG